MIKTSSCRIRALHSIQKERWERKRGKERKRERKKEKEGKKKREKEKENDGKKKTALSML